MIDRTKANLGSAQAGLIVVTLLWGATFATSKVAVDDVPPLTMATLRFGLASLALLPLYVRERRGLPFLPSSYSAWRTLILLGVTAVVAYNALFFGGLRLAPSSDSVLLIPTTNPIWTAIFAAFLLGERTSKRLRIGFAIALVGMALVLLGGSSASFGGDRLLGNLMFVAAASVFGLSHVVGRMATRYVSPLGATTLAGIVGTGLLIPMAVAEEGIDDIARASLGFWPAVAFVAFGGTALAYILWYRGIQMIGAGSAAFYTNLVPVFGLTISALFLAEYPTFLQIVGGAIMLAAVIWATRRPPVPTPVPVRPLSEGSQT